MRVKGGIVTKRRHKKVLEMAKGYRQSRSKNFRKAKEAVLHAGQYSYVHRKKRPGQLRRNWIRRISIALEQFEISYSKFMANLKAANIVINRKMLAELAVNQPEIFKSLTILAK
jgi:large subunit ribosomal protein L20